jgi:hypothetical protein
MVARKSFAVVLGCLAISACADEEGGQARGDAVVETTADGSLSLTANNMRFVLLKPETAQTYGEQIRQATIHFSSRHVEVTSPARARTLVLGLRGRSPVDSGNEFVGGDGFAITTLGPQDDSVPVIQVEESALYGDEFEIEFGCQTSCSCGGQGGACNITCQGSAPKATCDCNNAPSCTCGACS